MKKSILIIGALFLSGFIFHSCGKKVEKNEIDSSKSEPTILNGTEPNKMNGDVMQSMDKMMTNMKDMKMTGDFDIDFASSMIIHHQAAIDMSEEQVVNGNDEQIKTMAQNIISTQKAEIIALQNFIKKYKTPEAESKNSTTHNELDITMKAMMDKMMKMQMSDNVDKDFVMMMILHHEGAVQMAKDEISHGKQFELKEMAQKMITDQTKEIKEFNAWLASK